MSALETSENKPAGTGRKLEYVTPLVNLHQDADGYTLDVEMPGVNKTGVEVTVEDGRLVLTGRRHAEAESGRAVYRERTQSEYRRVFDLDPAIDAGKITARIEQGLLVVHLPKAETVKPRKVAIS